MYLHYGFLIRNHFRNMYIEFVQINPWTRVTTFIYRSLLTRIQSPYKIIISYYRSVCIAYTVINDTDSEKEKIQRDARSRQNLPNNSRFYLEYSIQSRYVTNLMINDTKGEQTVPKQHPTVCWATETEVS